MNKHPKLILLIGALGISTSPILIKMSTSPALTIAFFRMLITVLILTPFILAKNTQEIKGLKKNQIISIMISGIFLGFHFSAWILSLKYTTVASATILVNTSPIMLLLISYFILKEKVSKKETLAIIIAFLGSILLALNDFSNSSHAFLGDLYAISGAAFICVYLIIGNRIRQHVSMTSYTYLTYAVAAITIFIINLFVKQNMIVTDLNEYLLFICMAIFPTLLGHSLFNWSLKYVSPTFVSMAILTEPILSSTFAIFIFKEFPTSVQLIGAVIVLASLFFYNQVKNQKI